MKQENAVFDQVLKASPEEFIKAWLAEVAATGSVSGTTAATTRANCLPRSSPTSPPTPT